MTAPFRSSRSFVPRPPYLHPVLWLLSLLGCGDGVLSSHRMDGLSDGGGPVLRDAGPSNRNDAAPREDAASGLDSGPRAQNWPTPPTPVPDPGTRDLAQIIQDNPQGGVVWLPDGTYEKGTVDGFRPAKPLVLVAETQGGVVVSRSDHILGKTSLSLNDVDNVAFIGMRFERITVALNNVEDIAFWYTFHTIPPQSHPEARRKLCGAGRDPTAFKITRSDRIRLYGVTIDDVGHDGIKVGSTNDLAVVGTTMTKIFHQSYQTQTSAADAASCGHSASDKFHHADAIQIFPGGVNDLLVSDSYTDRGFMMNVSGSGGSSENLQIQRTVFEPIWTKCHAINTRVKSSASASATMDVTVLDSKVFCDRPPLPLRWIFISNNTRCPNHALDIRDVEFNFTPGPSSNPADDWRADHPYERWPCFLKHDAGWDGFSAACIDQTGFPSGNRLSTTGAAGFSEHGCNGVY